MGGLRTTGRENGDVILPEYVFNELIIVLCVLLEEVWSWRVG